MAAILALWICPLKMSDAVSSSFYLFNSSDLVFLDLVLGDTDDTTTYRDTKSIAILLSILHAANLLCTTFRNSLSLL